MKALVYKSTGSWYTVKSEAGEFLNARIKGVFRIEDITSTNPLAVGDWVNIETEEGAEGTAVIDEIFPRSNYINRQSPRVKYQQHIIAANLDQSVLIATLKEPRTSRGFIDRFLVVCEMYHVPAILLFNKTDIYREKELGIYEELSAIYRSLGYRVDSVSVQKKQGLEELDRLLQDKTTLISGHSGVGKSSLINSLLPGEGIKTQDVSGWSGKGMHTTTFATMYDLPGGGRIIDTPGIRELAITNLDREELSHYFPEMRERLKDCRYNNCMHVNEPKCAVKQAVADGDIDEKRYISYLNILDSLDEQKGY
ncbi:ribosome small subunit-dependent GTPase A [Niabella aurantiaca]|uniref:ribosome small subunit-dependent GTPase A n=1 Tax=Niabella aurantiaca TaxID=379900 RepID=UPI00036E90A2|nr:ribosome small subunit-dependent GTPase A [Niabella aurantiaca]